MQAKVENLTKELSLLEEVLYMNTDVIISHGILRTRKKPLHHSKQSTKFKRKSLVKSEQELKSVCGSMTKAIEKIYVYLKDLHTESDK